MYSCKEVLLHLSLIQTIGPSVIEKILHATKNLKTLLTIYEWDLLQWQRRGLTDQQAKKVVDGLSDDVILHKELELIAKHKVHVVTILDEQYPTELKNIYRPPIVLYYWGKHLSEYQQTIAVVGARAATSYGKRVVNKLIPKLVVQNIAIVSGGALGIDAFAHQVALDASGSTIAVMGSGLLQLYPKSNRKLFQQILDNSGTLVSSFPLTMEALPRHFPARNRIISGLSKGTLVVQAAEKSGSLITAHYALEQGKEVFAVPGIVGDQLSAGCNKLIQQGAKLVTSAEDIMSELDSYSSHSEYQQESVFSLSDRNTLRCNSFGTLTSTPMPQRTQQGQREGESKEKAETFEQNSPENKIIASCLEPQSMDDLLLITGLEPAELQGKLFNLQISGAVGQNSAGLWERL